MIDGYRLATPEEMSGDITMIGGRPHVRVPIEAPARTEFRGFKIDGGHNIRQIVWFPAAPIGTLAVEFSGGATYTYTGVPVETYLALRDAASVGSAFDRLVKKAGYAFTKVTG